MPSTLLCLDPGKKTGLAVLEMGDNAPRAVLSAEARPFAEVYDGILNGSALPPGCVAVVMEDTRSLPVYARRRSGSAAAQGAKARDVGRIDAMCDLLESAVSRANLPLVPYVPRGKKWSHEATQALTGWSARRSSEHARDAIRAGWSITTAHLCD